MTQAPALSLRSSSRGPRLLGAALPRRSARRRLAGGGLLLFLCALAGLGGCFDVERITLGNCGNGVLDPDEDCEPVGQSDAARCGQPGTPTECRIECDSTADCPANWHCGSDELCRVHAGSFTTVGAVPFAPGPWFALADTEGDGRTELATVLPSGAFVVKLDPTSDAPQRWQLPAPATRSNPMALGQLDAEGPIDLAYPMEDGLAWFQGRAHAAPEPASRVVLTLPDPVASGRMVRANLLRDIVPPSPSEPGGSHAHAPGDEFMLFLGTEANLGFTAAYAPPGNLLMVSYLPASPEELGPGTVVADFCEGEACVCSGCLGDGMAEVAAVFRSSPAEERFYEDVYLFVTSQAWYESSGHLQFVVKVADAPLSLGQGDYTLGTMAALDLNADGHLDLVIAGGQGIHAAYGAGDGSFHSDAGADGLTTLLPTLAECVPGSVLAFADFDEDGEVDVVLPDGVWLSSAPGACVLGLPTPSVARGDSAPWQEAVVADLQGDGHADLVATTGMQGGLDVWIGGGAAGLSMMKVPTAYPATHPALGDFDGDHVKDVAMVEVGAGSSGRDALSVSFLDPGGIPTVPKRLTTLDGVRELDVGNIAVAGEQHVDTFDDLLVATREIHPTTQWNGPTLSILRGRPDRQMLSPAQLTYAIVEDNDVSKQRWSYYKPQAVSIGRFPSRDGDARPGVVVFASLIDVTDGFPVEFPYVLETVPFDPASNIPAPVGDLPSNAFEQEPPAGHTFVGAELLSTDVDGDGADEPVLLTWETEASDETSLAGYSLSVRVPLARVEGDRTFAWDAERFVTLDRIALVGYPALPSADRAPLSGESLALVAERTNGAPQLCHLSGAEGVSEASSSLVMAALDYGSEMASADAAIGLRVLSPAWLRQLHDPGSSLPTADDVGRIAAPSGELILGFACIDADADSVEEVAMLSVPLAAFDADRTASAEAHVTVVELLADGVTFSEPRLLATFGEDDIPSLAEAGPSVLTPVHGLAAGDVDGDGLVDLVVGSSTRATLLRADPVKP